MVCITYQLYGMPVYACYICTDTMHASYYGACVKCKRLCNIANSIYSKNFRVTAVLEMKCFEVTVVLDVYHKPTPITTLAVCACMHPCTFIYDCNFLSVHACMYDIFCTQHSTAQIKQWVYLPHLAAIFHKIGIHLQGAWAFFL